MVQSDRPYGGRSKAERSAERRARLVAATVTLLGTVGEARTTMTAICAEAGLTERYFYESFRGRDEALVAALEAVAAEVGDAAVAAVAQGTGEPGEVVREVMGAVVDLLAARPATGRVLTVESSANPALRARRRALVASFADLVATQTLALYGERAHRGPAARHRATVVVAGYAELVAAWLTGEVELDRDELVDLGAELLALGVRQP